MIECEDNECNVLKIYGQQCVAYKLIKLWNIPTTCPCKECILRPKCETPCQDKLKSLDYIHDYLMDIVKTGQHPNRKVPTLWDKLKKIFVN